MMQLTIILFCFLGALLLLAEVAPAKNGTTEVAPAKNGTTATCLLPNDIYENYQEHQNTVKKTYTKGEKITITCKRGFTLNKWTDKEDMIQGSQTLNCTENGFDQPLTLCQATCREENKAFNNMTMVKDALDGNLVGHITWKDCSQYCINSKDCKGWYFERRKKNSKELNNCVRYTSVAKATTIPVTLDDSSGIVVLGYRDCEECTLPHIRRADIKPRGKDKFKAEEKVTIKCRSGLILQTDAKGHYPNYYTKEISSTCKNGTFDPPFRPECLEKSYLNQSVFDEPYLVMENGICTSVSEKECELTSNLTGSYNQTPSNKFERSTKPGVPPGCSYENNTNYKKYYFNGFFQTTYECSEENRCVCKNERPYRMVKSGTCTSVSEESCKLYSYSHGKTWRGTVAIAYFETGCYYTPLQSSVIFIQGGKSSKASCSDTMQCLCDIDFPHRVQRYDKCKPSFTEDECRQYSELYHDGRIRIMGLPIDPLSKSLNGSMGVPAPPQGCHVKGMKNRGKHAQHGTQVWYNPFRSDGPCSDKEVCVCKSDGSENDSKVNLNLFRSLQDNMVIDPPLPSS